MDHSKAPSWFITPLEAFLKILFSPKSIVTLAKEKNSDVERFPKGSFNPGVNLTQSTKQTSQSWKTGHMNMEIPDQNISNLHPLLISFPTVTFSP